MPLKKPKTNPDKHWNYTTKISNNFWTHGSSWFYAFFPAPKFSKSPTPQSPLPRPSCSHTESHMVLTPLEPPRRSAQAMHSKVFGWPVVHWCTCRSNCKPTLKTPESDISVTWPRSNAQPPIFVQFFGACTTRLTAEHVCVWPRSSKNLCRVIRPMTPRLWHPNQFWAFISC